MKALGPLMLALCLVASICLATGVYAARYGPVTTIPMFAHDPPEGWDYWLRREYWHDMLGLLLCVLGGMVCLILPLAGYLRDSKPAGASSRAVDLALLVLTSVYVTSWAALAAWCFRQGGYAFVIPLALMLVFGVSMPCRFSWPGCK